MRRLFPLILIAILIGGLSALNQGMKKNVSADHDDDDDQQQQQQQSQKATPPPMHPGAPVQDTLPPEISAGNPAQAKYKITLGWTYDEAISQNPMMARQLFGTLQSWQAAHPDTSLEIVDLDIPPSDRSPAAASVNSLGLAVNGVQATTPAHVPLNGNLDDPAMALPALMGYLQVNTSK